MNRCKAAAAADVLLCPEDPELRQYRCGVAPFDAGIEFAHHHDGASSFVYVVRAGTSTAIKVIANRAWIGPDALARFQRAPTFEMSALATRALNEPELRYQELTGLFWCEDGGEWQGFKATIDGTSNLEICKPLLQLICVGPKAYYQFAQRYHEVTPDPSALKAIFTLTPMSQELVDSFTEECKLSSLAKDFAELGYPLA
ncbi:MAG: hypothetical protein ACFCU1_13070 [Sumerlaeia bacterium]